ncbi:hypothetical protein AMAG_05011 [Allomyces macrogynus ATCC 38327]|uniref:SH3 domain-containing protein n=1 Tax=Allomyces macrogynus (strain ATCC 38327) TaxID=578462 RepID=A0A0L0S793_ALLM3|nr:hypothetical protein AMAG_05011 [Allomyces macrogynus ATCC 38327]|eukprot:KNE58199.1 hypothetical protein AMAG_05011 [Allomyces macrogynus ATCC 38327]
MHLPQVATTLFASAVLLLAAAAPQPVDAFPQVTIPGIGTIGGNTNQQPASSSAAPSATSSAMPTASASASAKPTGTATSAAPTATPTVEDKCPKGKCKVPGRGDQECIHLGSTNVCGSFVGNYVPLNVSDYFRKRMPTKRYYNIPNLDSAAMFDNLWSTSEDYGFMGKYGDDYMRNIAGCAIPNQRWFKTWFCADLLDHFVDNPCTKPSNFTICTDTFTERADSVSADLGNSTACPVGNEGRKLGEIYVSQLKGYSKLSKDANCVSGAATEANDRTLKQCGYTSTWTACNKGCKDVTPEQCAKAIREAQNAPAASSSCDPNDVTCNGKGSSKVGMIVGIVVAVLVVIALAVLYHIRFRKTGGEEKPVPAAPEPEPEVPAAAPAPVAPAPFVQQPIENQPLMTPPPQGPGMVQMPPPQPPVQMPQPSVQMPASPMQMPPAPAPAGLGPIAAGAAAAGLAVGAAAGAAAASNNSNAGLPAPLQPPADCPEQVTESTVAKVQWAYQPTNGDELELNPGDILTVFHRYSDGWGYATRHANPPMRPTAVTGYFPLMVLGETAARSAGAVPDRFESLSRTTTPRN